MAIVFFATVWCGDWLCFAVVGDQVWGACDVWDGSDGLG